MSDFVQVEWDDREVIKALQKLQAAAGDVSPALKEIGEVLLKSTKERFETGTSPDGSQWADNEPSTIARKGRNKPLFDQGILMREIHYDPPSNNELVFGSSMEYAAMQQFGGTKDEFPNLWGDIEARPFLGVSEEDDVEILNIVERHLMSST